MEKTPLLIAGVVGALLSLLAALSYRAMIPSSEARQLKIARTQIADVRAQHETAKAERANLEGQVALLQAKLSQAESTAIGQRQSHAIQLSVLQEQLEESELKATREREAHTKRLARIDSQLSPFLELAKERYPSEPADNALDRLRDDLLAMNERTTKLEAEVEAVRDYSDVAMLTFNGSQYVGGDVKFNTPLTKILEGTFTEVSPGRFRRVCTPESQGKYRQAIDLLPRFPFAHYWLALCLRDSGDSTWRTHAKTARSIFQLTTRIAGHQASHDEALAYLAELLDP